MYELSLIGNEPIFANLLSIGLGTIFSCILSSFPLEFSNPLMMFILLTLSHPVLQELLVVGTDTTSIAVEWALVQLLKHPDITKKAQDELDDVVGHERVLDERDIPQLKYLQAVVKETLRLHPPAPLLLPHESTEACEVGGYHIPAKTRIFVNVWAVHRHPSAYENPLDFNPERFVGSGLDMKGTDFQLLPFGSGRRMCPGMIFSVLMVQIILARLLHSFNWTLPEGENPQDIDMQELFGGTIPKAIPLEAVASARLPLHLYTAKTLTQCS
jgi:cytochrome P450